MDSPNIFHICVNCFLDKIDSCALKKINKKNKKIKGGSGF